MIKFDDSFNWLALLKDLAAGMPLSEVEWQQIKRMAAAWPTCACGQLCAALPRNRQGAPRDDILIQLGGAFCGQICTAEWTSALKLFHMIEARTSELLKNLNQPNTDGTEPVPPTVTTKP